MRAGYLGPKATFTDIAVQNAFPDVERIAYTTIPDCFKAVKNKEVDMAIVPFENALEGSVHLTTDYLFHETNPPIRAEIIVPIQQHLMVHPMQYNKWNEVERILSHPHALAQCHKFLHQQFRGVTLEQMTSTAAAAKYVSEHPESNMAAIANELAAEKYNLQIVKENIHDYDFNHTRFIVLAHNDTEILPSLTSTYEKTTIMVTLPSDRAGSLHQVLSAFAWRKINLSKIESRPLKTGLGHYFFMIDINQTYEDQLVKNAIEEIESLGCQVKILGSYFSYHTQK
ncbi:prephenate dehydratase [Heyndrickxia sporothermodurans]|uniref:Prephenate dehydratase n=1 Tax=Heyndrickxia sporothermodurans TaxID=46224 RepID=A0A150LFS4_9BACI|nr:prephenate dehydratase [Heyndrickxia sporothermodurans]KYD10889.1 Prephenate dehydratase [Heyndrickxia sporothermodurans]MBL5766142.1 prephenate dehydratase [Heyndrickxia sporothermodurans]MBL5769583.1 prephenate dehydratase [Heyndrickxia sporothermodurans]MBL5773366.1 prephenate dehydratase [Heyndrickxia sporothermodurans]MBL5776747.1 prephenate dehydratase [Heyndrickxia sporothermodurans]